MSNKFTNTRAIRNWHEFRDVKYDYIREIPELTAFEKHIGMTNPEHRHNFEEFVEQYQNENPNWEKPSVRLSQEDGGSSKYIESTNVELGDDITPDAGDWEQMSHDLDGMVIHPESPHVLMAFKDNVVHFMDIDEKSHMENGTLSTMFPEFTGAIEWVIRTGVKGTNNEGETLYWNIHLVNQTGTQYKYEFSGGDIKSFSFQGSGDWSSVAGGGMNAGGTEWKYYFKMDNGVPKVDLVGNTGNFVAFGGDTGVLTGLPEQIPDACVNDRVNNEAIITIGDAVYYVDLSNNTVKNSGGTKYNQSNPPNFKQFKWTKPNHPFQLNLDYCSDETWDASENPAPGSVQYWNGDRRASETGWMWEGNWIDGELYTLTMDKDATEMEIFNHNDPNPIVEVGTNWKIEGWGQTILRGHIVEDHEDESTILFVKKGSNGMPEYRAFNPAFDVNPQEQFTQANTEVYAYWIYDTYDNINTGMLLRPELTKYFL